MVIKKDINELCLYELAKEVQHEVHHYIKSLVRAKNDITTWRSTVKGMNMGPSVYNRDLTWDKEQIQTLYAIMVNCSMKICKNIKRGRGNRCLMSPNIIQAFSIMPEYRITERSVIDNLVGEIDGISIYQDILAHQTTKRDYIISAYKGGSIFDAGMMLVLYSLKIHEDNSISIKYAINKNDCSEYYEYIDVDLRPEEVL